MAFFPNFTKDRIAADITVGLGTGAFLGTEMLSMPDLPQLSAASLRVALSIFLVVALNHVEQEVIIDDENGWHWDRNERPWMKALNTAALVALPELLTWFVQTSFEGDVGPMHTAKMIALLTAIGFSMMDVVKDLFALALQKKEIRNEIESEMRNSKEWEESRTRNAQHQAQEETERRLAEAKDEHEREALKETIQKELDQRARARAQEKEQEVILRRKQAEQKLKERIPWDEAVRLARGLGKTDKEIYRMLAKRAHSDVRSDVDPGVMQAINAAYNKDTDTFLL